MRFRGLGFKPFGGSLVGIMGLHQELCGFSAAQLWEA